MIHKHLGSAEDALHQFDAVDKGGLTKPAFQSLLQALCKKEGLLTPTAREVSSMNCFNELLQ